MNKTFFICKQQDSCAIENKSEYECHQTFLKTSAGVSALFGGGIELPTEGRNNKKRSYI